jgi:hypothetical protein
MRQSEIFQSKSFNPNKESHFVVDQRQLAKKESRHASSTRPNSSYQLALGHGINSPQVMVSTRPNDKHLA